jgi:chemotaxis family two-component system response regulator PixG
MNTISMSSYRPFQKLHPLSLLAQLSSRQASGCLQVATNSASWSIYLEHGKLTYASNSIDPFDRLDRHLRRLSAQVPALVSAIRVQVRLLFETAMEHQPTQSRDYQAICWLVEQQYLTTAQAAMLIEDLAKEVVESFLAIKEGNYELVDRHRFNEFPIFCHLDLRSLVEHCQHQLRRRQSGSTFASPVVRPDFLNRNGGGDRPKVAPKPPVVVQPNAAYPPAPISTQPAAPIPKTVYTIACIDDSPTVLNAINSFLDDKSFSVLMINNPVKALMQIVRSKPDLILLDVEMPNLDGYELCSLLRRHSFFKDTPIIMVTGNTGFIDRAKAKLVRASGYLTKPFTQSDLLKMVFKHLT